MPGPGSTGPLNPAGVRVDREHLIAALAQPPVHVVGTVGLGRAGHPGDRHPLAGQERSRGLVHALHELLPSVCQWSCSASAARSSARTLAKISTSSSPGATWTA